MTKPKNIKYKNGMSFSCGPPIRAGAYEKWNWCKLCAGIYEKNILRCPNCNQMMRLSAKSKKNNITKAERFKNRIEVIRKCSKR